MNKPSIGRIVHFFLPDIFDFQGRSEGFGVGAHRPAVITHVWKDYGGQDDVVQLQAFLDGSNDGITAGVRWFTSVHHDEETKKPGTWHWPERVE